MAKLDTKSGRASALFDEERGEEPAGDRVRAARRARSGQPGSRESLEPLDESDGVDPFDELGRFPPLPPSERGGRGREAAGGARSRRSPDPSLRRAALPAAEGDEPFLRARNRVAVRRTLVPRSRLGRILLAAGLAAAGVLLGLAAYAVYHFFTTDARFRIESSSSIAFAPAAGTGMAPQVSRDQVLGVFAEDIGRNIFFVPLRARQRELEQIPWVEQATVMRLLPNRIEVALTERVPVAFVRAGSHVQLVDAHGVLLELPAAALAARRYSFPVVSGIRGSDPLSVRAARMQLLERFLAELDAGGEKVSSTLSEVDVSDPEDVRAMLPGGGTSAGQGAILAHFGDDDFLRRYQSYRAHLAEWRRQYPRLASVDLRYDQQVVLEMAHGAADGEPAGGPAVQPAAAGRPGGSSVPDPDSAAAGRRGLRSAAPPAPPSGSHAAAHATSHPAPPPGSRNASRPSSSSSSSPPLRAGAGR